MERLRKFLRLPLSERWLLVRVTFLLRATQAALRLLPFQTVYRWMNQLSNPVDSRTYQDDTEADRICRVVNKSGRHFLGVDSCFPQALVGKMLLERRGYSSKVRIGVIKDADGSLRAHAWVERDGVVVIGGPVAHVEKYTPLTDLDRIRP
jgi:hypothetical protein